MRTKTPKIDREKVTSTITLENPSNSSDLPVEDISRMSFAIDAAGNILWDRMQAKTRARLKEIIASPDTAKVLGVESPVSAPVEVFDPAWTGSLFDSIGKLESFLASKIYHIAPDIADQAFTYNEREKEKLSLPMAKVINKYASVWMIQFKDEIALAFLFVTITAVKLQMATTLQNMRVVTERSAKPPQSIRNDPSSADLDAATLERSVRDGTLDA